MRNSQVVILSGLGVVLAGIVVLVVGLRVMIGSAAEDSAVRADGSEAQFEGSESLSPALENFDGLVLRSAWDIQLRQGEAWSVEIDVDEDVRDRLNVGVTDGKLVLQTDGRPRRGWFGFNREANEARITMPELRSIEVQGAANIQLDEFRGTTLSIAIAGAGNVEADGGEFEDLDLTIDGAGNVDLHWVEVTNASVQLAGASNVELTMNGGELVGSISGLGRLSYGGSVSREDVRSTGFATVERVGR